MLKLQSTELDSLDRSDLSTVRQTTRWTVTNINADFPSVGLYVVVGKDKKTCSAIGTKLVNSIMRRI
jgi:hypothetical protein